MSKIEWTETTWNPVTGCSKISIGCANCYAERMANRLKAMGLAKYESGFKLKYHNKVLKDPYKWKKSKIIFVNSMSDLFHKDLPFEFIKKVFKVMNDNPQHIFQILTKRADILYKYSPELKWSDNIWVGVTVESSQYIDRIDYLSKVPSVLRFLSLEPLLSDIPNLNLKNIDWVIVGGESGPKSRPIKEEWILNILYQCKENKVPFFFKQWGGTNKKRSGKLLNGKIYKEMPFNKFGI